MGNNCCSSCQNNKEHSIESFILLNLSRLRNHRHTTYEELSLNFRHYFSIDLLDIDASPYQWITKESYDRYIIDFLNESNCRQVTSAFVLEFPFKCLCLPYSSSSLHVYLPSFTHHFHLFLLIWIVGIANLSFNEKLNLIKEIIIKTSKIITYATFNSFLLTYFTIFLIEITQQFLTCPEIVMNSDEMLDVVFNTKNVDDYHHLFKSHLKLIVLQSKCIYINDKNMKNVYLTDKELTAFYEEFPFMLNAQELREQFYERYDVATSASVIDHSTFNESCA